MQLVHLITEGIRQIYVQSASIGSFLIKQAWCGITAKCVVDEGLYGLPYGPNSLMTLRRVRILKPTRIRLSECLG